MNALLRQRIEDGERRGRLYGGPGVRLHQTGFGSLMRFQAAPVDFSHPWLAELAGNGAATFLPGMVNGVLATHSTGSGPAARSDGVVEPIRLTWKRLMLTAEGMGYFAAEVTCDPENDFAVTKVAVVQVADPDTDGGTPVRGGMRNATGGALPLTRNRARWPLAMIQQRASGLVELFQITFFNLSHRVRLKADGRSVSRHFFW